MVRLAPRLYFLRFPLGHAYLWVDDDGLTLIDCGVAGSGARIAAGIRSLGRDPADVRQLVLTHFHHDHVGAANEVAAWGDVVICAHRDDAAVIRGRVAGAPPVLLDWERPIFEQANAGGIVQAAPVRVDRDLDDGDTLEFGGGAQAVAAAGHTPGSVAIHLPEDGVLFTGDTVARLPDGQVILGVFNVDRDAAIMSLRRLAALDPDLACFGHGEPVTSGAGSALRDAARRPHRPAGAQHWTSPVVHHAT
ncbi:MBL fold metallo-hydrolase [Frankia sp. AgKG'84/4]|uniref:MBL fold metallo-hydrolase n=1 Tax=Frankia sp. AgKG'84/4 TaxID=573490 RepID=UPI00202A2460|nr:MBL fold metallo-hydrolase [Frankia sp. AgKG'84/4]MCL9794703.1 MBL fold metallo-hydrolase [Frankia sp. AgKG'84/4]